MDPSARKTSTGRRSRYSTLFGALAVAALIASQGFPAIGAPLDDIGRRLPAETSAKSGEVQLLPALRESLPTMENNPGLFVLTAVTIRGSTVFKPEDFAPLYEPYLTRLATISDVAKLAETITEKYRRSGYFLSRAVIPAQDAMSGLLNINIVEGYIAEVTIEGADVRGVRERAQTLTQRRPLRLAELEKTLALIGDMNGITVKTARIEPDLNDMSVHRLVLSVERDSVQASLYVDNRGAEATGRLQTYARVNFNSVLLDGDQFGVGLFSTPRSFNDLMYGEAWYAMILNRTGTSLTVSGGLTASGAKAGLFGLQTEGEIARGSLLLSHPFVRGRSFSLWGNLGFEARNLHGEQLGITIYDERLRILSGSLNLRHNAWGGTSAIYVEASRGLGSLSASGEDDTRPSRIDDRSDFLKAELQLSRYQNIGKTFGLYVAASAQISADPLPASEKFALGGAQFGRAYDYWAISGDHGVGGLVELRYGKDPGLSFLKFYQVYAYYDKGWVWNQNVAPQFREASLASTGLGIRLTLPGSFYVSFESSLPVSQSRYAHTNNAWRNFFSISTTF